MSLSVKNTELEIVHANNIASIIINTEPHELKHKIEVYNNEVHGFKDLIEASKANADLCIKLEKEKSHYSEIKKGISKETSDKILYKVKKLEDEARGVNHNKRIDVTQQFFNTAFGIFLLIGSVLFAVEIYKTLT